MNRIFKAVRISLLLSPAIVSAETMQSDQGDAACSLIDTELTDLRQSEYADLIAQEFGNGLRRSDVNIYAYLGGSGWSVVYGDIPTAETAYFFFETVGRHPQYRDVWSGLALRSEREEISQWAEELGAPDELAHCFAQRVTSLFPSDIDLSFGVNVTFSDEAAANLLRRNEEVIVLANYYADPTPEGAAFGDDVGRINLGTQELWLPVADALVDVTGEDIRTDLLQWAEEGSIAVNVNVVSARLSSPDNLLSCDVIDGDIAAVQATAPIALYCALISENVATTLKP